MRIGIRWVALAALAALGLTFGLSSPQAASGLVHVEIYKASFFVGGSGGGGTLRFRGRTYPLSIGGVHGGASIGFSKSTMSGTVTNIRHASDVAGTYTTFGAGSSVIGGNVLVQLRNEKGAVLELRGREVGLEFAVDVGGMTISLR